MKGHSMPQIRTLEALNKEAINSLTENEILLPDSQGYIITEGLEKSYKFSQADILSQLNYGFNKKIFDLHLSYGPYYLDSSRNGSHLLLGGKLGSLSLFNFNTYSLLSEINVQETIRDIKLLQDHTLFAAAQKKYIYIYDHKGIEIHCLKQNMMTYCLDYLPFHFLMTSIGEFGEISYDDISTGQVAAKHKTHRGPCKCISHNSQNAVTHLGHLNGTVTLWTPNISKPVVEFLAHKGPVVSHDCFRNYIATSGVDGLWKVWDNRTYKCLHSFNYFGTPPSKLCFSQTGIIALGFGSHLQLWKEIFEKKPTMPYLIQKFNGSEISSLIFRPYEDICIIGKNDGITSILVPGSGIANYDNLEENPTQTKTQRREKQINRLLEKIPSDMITLKSFGNFKSDATSNNYSNIEDFKLNESKRSKKTKNKMRGKGHPDKLKKAFNKLKAMKLRSFNRIRRANNSNANKQKIPVYNQNYNPLKRFS